jgi:hypothetical protein
VVAEFQVVGEPRRYLASRSERALRAMPLLIQTKWIFGKMLERDFMRKQFQAFLVRMGS